ncbi:metalloregulator ArsR/SmtB family transcription factor [Paraglaciecola aquimarina]|uniref:Metalloregulator ArsR/SmtB family transcription factor n=1 Tax=Paraglaciecola aquimarina TaxID=1235557 RepID=A0ABU3SWN8_9ALTE|nr:metalloregulator ArsR/SmtB family transcription factor [Paraglaciecola aquimarina]MDU0354433.1 metalloregulator ArsR/SmtB family transcription factor [Paraglaciecola aquimarina]
MKQSEMLENAAQAADLLKVMANKHRLIILCVLNDRELSVSEINQQIAIPQSTLSQHLAVLRKDGLVQTRREAQSIFYSLSSDQVKTIIATLHHLYCADYIP